MPKQKGLVYYNDFESVKGWQKVNLAGWRAHSGFYSNKLDSLNPYSLTFRQAFKDISSQPLKNVKVSLWVYFERDSKATLVMDVKDPNDKLQYWTGTNMGLEHIELTKWQKATSTPLALSARSSICDTCKWQEITRQFPIQDSAFNKPDNIVSIYVWNNEKYPVYIDDLRIEFIPKD